MPGTPTPAAGVQFHTPTIITKTPSGALLVSAGKPVLAPAWLSAIELAAEFGRDRDTVYRWRSEGIIPEKMLVAGAMVDAVRFQGRRKMEFRKELIAFLREKFAADR